MAKTNHIVIPKADLVNFNYIALLKPTSNPAFTIEFKLLTKKELVKYVIPRLHIFSWILIGVFSTLLLVGVICLIKWYRYWTSVEKFVSENED